MAESHATHDHIEFRAESITGARVCDGCGAFVLAGLQDEHQSFHDRLQLTLSAVQQQVQRSSKKKSKKKD